MDVRLLKVIKRVYKLYNKIYDIMMNNIGNIYTLDK